MSNNARVRERKSNDRVREKEREVIESLGERVTIKFDRVREVNKSEGEMQGKIGRERLGDGEGERGSNNSVI